MEESIFKLIDSHNRSGQRNTLIPHLIAVHTGESGEPVEQLPPISMKNTVAAAAPEVSSRGLKTAARGGSARGAGTSTREPDSAEVARRRQLSQMRGNEMALALAPGKDNFRAKLARGGVEVKDHVQDYKEKVKEQSIMNGLMRAQGETPQTRPAARKPEFSGRPQNVEPGQTNFVQDNKSKAVDHAARLREAAASKIKPAKYTGPESDRVAGRIPKYLIERKIEMEVDKAMALEEEERKKGGPKVMPEEERLSTLAELTAQKNAALLELNSIPISKTQLPVYQAQIRKLEARLAEIDNAILLFSRKVVYVQ